MRISVCQGRPNLRTNYDCWLELEEIKNGESFYERAYCSQDNLDGKTSVRALKAYLVTQDNIHRSVNDCDWVLTGDDSTKEYFCGMDYCMGSDHVIWEDVIFKCIDNKLWASPPNKYNDQQLIIYAPNIERIIEAVKHVMFDKCWDADI